MYVDALLTFLPSPLSLVAGAGISIASGTIDLLGAGVGVAPPNIIGNVTTFGTDFGVGAHMLELMCRIGTAPTTSNGCTLNLAWQFAADQGSGGSYQPSTWYTVEETGPIAVASLAANTRIGAWKYPQMFPFNIRPRFTRLLAQVPAAENFTAGTLSQAFLTDVPPAYSIANQPRNYAVS